ncbi:MAG: hypothetical protein R3C28_13195 [Pirellulaceae bacterium]
MIAFADIALWCLCDGLVCLCGWHQPNPQPNPRCQRDVELNHSVEAPTESGQPNPLAFQDGGYELGPKPQPTQFVPEPTQGGLLWIIPALVWLVRNW